MRAASLSMGFNSGRLFFSGDGRGLFGFADGAADVLLELVDCLTCCTEDEVDAADAEDVITLT